MSNQNQNQDILVWHWLNGSVIKSACYSSRRLAFRSQFHIGPLTTACNASWRPLLAATGTCTHMAYTCKDTLHMRGHTNSHFKTSLKEMNVMKTSMLNANGAEGGREVCGHVAALHAPASTSEPSRRRETNVSARQLAGGLGGRSLDINTAVKLKLFSRTVFCQAAVSTLNPVSQKPSPAAGNHTFIFFLSFFFLQGLQKMK